VLGHVIPRPTDGLDVGHVERERQPFAATCLDLCTNRAQWPNPSTDHNDIRACLGQREGDPPPDTFTRASDQCDPSRERHAIPRNVSAVLRTI
jgi:hypothetical protein